MRHENALLGVCAWRGLVFVVFVLFAVSSTFAADRDVAMKVGSAAVEWSAAPDGARWVLDVSLPGGDVIRREFAAEETPSFSLFDKRGGVLKDGQYNYQLTAAPAVSSELEKHVREARESGDEAATDSALQRAGVGQGQVVSGTFTVLGGAFVASDLQEPESPAAGPFNKTTFTDFLCVGFDCPASPSASDSTIFMMENNTRIKYDDTSSAAGFPNRDWSLNANDSASGGANRFWIQDCGVSSQGGCSGNAVFSIEAGSRTNALWIDNSNRVGFGTSTPVIDLHAVSGNSPGLRLEQNTSSGFSAQVWDVVGNESSFFVRDATNGSTLPFRIRPGAPSSSLVIDTDGDVGIGTLSPAADSTLHVVANTGAANDVVLMQNNGPTRFALSNTSAGDIWRFNYANSGELRIGDNDANVEFQIDGAGNLTISGGLITTGGGGNCTAGDPCDGVFHPDFAVPSIEDHAADMWRNSFLPAVGPTLPDQPINLVVKTLRMLNELEVAHIYIEQLSKQLQEKDQVLADVLGRLERLEQRSAD